VPTNTGVPPRISGIAVYDHCPAGHDASCREVPHSTLRRRWWQPPGCTMRSSAVSGAKLPADSIRVAMSQHHVPSGCRRATSVAYTVIGCNPDTFHSVCISAMSPVWMTCLMVKSKRAFRAARGASSWRRSRRSFVACLLDSERPLRGHRR
jgi:hypothetical protein